MKKNTLRKKRASDYQKLNAVIGEIEKALDRRLKAEKAMINICLRFPDVNLKSVVKCLLEDDYPIVEGAELHHDLCKALGKALEEYHDEDARKEDVTDLLKKWSVRGRKKALTFPKRD